MIRFMIFALTKISIKPPVKRKNMIKNSYYSLQQFYAEKKHKMQNQTLKKELISANSVIHMTIKYQSDMLVWSKKESPENI